VGKKNFELYIEDYCDSYDKRSCLIKIKKNDCCCASLILSHLTLYNLAIYLQYTANVNIIGGFLHAIPVCHSFGYRTWHPPLLRTMGYQNTILSTFAVYCKCDFSGTFARIPFLKYSAIIHILCYQFMKKLI
jgi:hypothetical protein